MKNNPRSTSRLNEFHYLVFVRLYMLIFESVERFLEHVLKFGSHLFTKFVNTFPARFVVVGVIDFVYDEQFARGDVSPVCWDYISAACVGDICDGVVHDGVKLIQTWVDGGRGWIIPDVMGRKSTFIATREDEVWVFDAQLLVRSYFLRSIEIPSMVRVVFPIGAKGPCVMAR